MKIVLIGYGSIGQALTPLLRRHFPEVESIRAFAADDLGKEVALQYNVMLAVNPLKTGNFRRILSQTLSPGDVLINVSVNVSSLALMKWCRENWVMYMDTCLEPWEGGYADQLTNYELRREAMKMRGPGRSTALVANGANPGLISHFVKKGLEELALIKGVRQYGSFAQLAMDLGVTTVQVAERDTQDTPHIYPRDTFVNTWSVDGFISELCYQPVEMGWGTHEERRDDVLDVANPCSAYMPGRTGLNTKVRSWVPSVGEQEAHLVTHHEAHSISEFLTVRDHGFCMYRPSAYYAYHPCKKAMRMIGRLRNGEIRLHEINKAVMQRPTSGQDELGALLIHDTGAYWYGSTLTVEQARSLASHNNATSLQVTATIVASLKWMLQHPYEGVIEPEDVDHNFILKESMAYLGHVGGVESSWRPADVETPQLRDFLIE